MPLVFALLLLLLSLCGGFTPFAPFGVLKPSQLGISSPLPSQTTSLNLFGKKDKDEDNEESSDTGDILNSPAFLSKKVEVLEKDLKEAEADLAAAVFELDEAKEEWASQMERLNGEYGAVKSRAFNATRDASKKATVKVVKEVLQVVDNFER